ncbi:GH3 auxin-responsive promoter family protein [Clostridium sp. SHJSY1]|uniref:GH3 auxin-responsive promoter family protein n=1 Tax=Clostridium sp. SHJSY1 TaxID=2942483 RepID=UPI002876AC53|nr:GH3 auxin-responsive promoter family protein [Clostridium sp. SHJSY1]MDS0526417.1 GH3 auxin-responsive promoter family protein [Clostridium sp. SHJSY1]
MSLISKALYKFAIIAGGKLKNNFNKITKDSRNVNEEILQKILKSNSKSEIGIKYGFQNIKSIDNFKRKVPISEYKDYDNYIERMANGEKNILTSDDILYFGHTSGTTGKQKLIPCTKRSRQVVAKYMALLIIRFSYDNFKDKWNYGKGLMISDMVMTTYTKGGIPICSATSGGMKGIKSIYSYLYTSPIEVMEIKDKDASIYLHLLFALEEIGLLYISGVFVSSVLDLFRVLEERHEELVIDIRKGEINKKLNIDESIRSKLKKYLTPDTSRADKLKEEFDKGFKGICKRIWPRVAYISTVTGGNFSIYNDKVNYYTDSLPIYSPAYGATEAMIGINPYVDKIRYVLVPDTAFYEFIPSKDSDKKFTSTFCLDELKLGEKYEVVVTSYNGLYRYRIGDVVKVVGFYNNSPEIEFLYRKNQVLNMVAEKTNEEHLTSSIRNTMKELDLNIVDYTTEPDNSITPGRYIFYFEFKNRTQPSKKILEDILDRELRNSNLAYDRARNNNKLGMVKVVILYPKTFNLIREFLIKKGVSKNQIKIPRVIINNKNILDILDKNRYS